MTYVRLHVCNISFLGICATLALCGQSIKTTKKKGEIFAVRARDGDVYDPALGMENSICRLVMTGSFFLLGRRVWMLVICEVQRLSFSARIDGK